MKWAASPSYSIWTINDRNLGGKGPQMTNRKLRQQFLLRYGLWTVLPCFRGLKVPLICTRGIYTIWTLRITPTHNFYCMCVWFEQRTKVKCSKCSHARSTRFLCSCWESTTGGKNKRGVWASGCVVVSLIRCAINYKYAPQPILQYIADTLTNIAIHCRHLNQYCNTLQTP